MLRVKKMFLLSSTTVAAEEEGAKGIHDLVVGLPALGQHQGGENGQQQDGCISVLWTQLQRGGAATVFYEHLGAPMAVRATPERLPRAPERRPADQ